MWCKICKNSCVTRSGEICVACQSADMPDDEYMETIHKQLIDNIKSSRTPMWEIDNLNE